MNCNQSLPNNIFYTLWLTGDRHMVSFKYERIALLMGDLFSSFTNTRHVSCKRFNIVFN